MDTSFMNSGNSRTSEYDALILKRTDKLDLKRIIFNIRLFRSYSISIFKIILGIFLKNIMKMLMIHQSEYM